MNPVLLALIAGLCAWGATALGAAAVFLSREFRRITLDTMLGFAAGIMIAASFWSLLVPSIEMSVALNGAAWKWFPPLSGFLLGGGCLWCIDRILPHLHSGLDVQNAEGIQTQWRRSVLLVLAITLHKIPEGLAIGVVFGAAGTDLSTATLAGAMSLAVGISIQSIPEGTAVSVSLRREGISRLRCFLYGQCSGSVYLIAAVLGVLIVTQIVPILPYALAFAAGAMIYVVVEELIPSSRENRHSDAGTIGAMIGFALMMTLDIILSDGITTSLQ